MQGNDAAQTSQRLGCDFLGKAAHHLGFQRDAHELRLADGRHIDRGDQCAGLGVDFDQPLFGQLLQRVAQGGEADAMEFREFGPQKRCTRRQVELDDLIAQRVIDPAPGRAAFKQAQICSAAEDAFGKSLCTLRCRLVQ